MKNTNSKQFRLKVILFVLLFSAALPAFSQAGGGSSGGVVPTQMTSLFDTLLGVFTGKIVQSILVMVFIGCCVAYAFGKDNEKFKRAIIAVGISIALIAAASFVVGGLWNAGGGDAFSL